MWEMFYTTGLMWTTLMEHANLDTQKMINFLKLKVRKKYLSKSSSTFIRYFLELLPKPGVRPPTQVVTTSTTTTTTTTPLPDVINKNPFFCKPSTTTVKGTQPCRGKLIFDSDFKNYLNNRDKLWTVQRKFASGPVSLHFFNECF